MRERLRWSPAMHPIGAQGQSLPPLCLAGSAQTPSESSLTTNPRNSYDEMYAFANKSNKSLA